MKFDYLIVGAGFAGATLAERFASQRAKTCLVIDRRDHVGGNAYDAFDSAGIRLHKYGPHYFRTNSDRVVDYLSRFTAWHRVDYKILSWTDGRLWQFPINLNTFEQLMGRASSAQEMADTLAKWRVPIDDPKNSEELIVSQIGVELYEKFFKNYTRKQWGRDAKELDPSVCGRIPVRLTRDDRSFQEKFQALPADGYAALIARMLDHQKIKVMLGEDYRKVMPSVSFSHMIYTGPIDEYFGCRLGPLPYRTLKFEPETVEKEFFQPAMQVNYPNDYDFTRIVEIKHATGQKSPVTTIVREYPEAYAPGKEPYYPILAPDSHVLYRKYAGLAEKEKGVSFVGRLATYRYLNMDQAVAMSLTEFERLSNV